MKEKKEILYNLAQSNSKGLLWVCGPYSNWESIWEFLRKPKGISRVKTETENNDHHLYPEKTSASVHKKTTPRLTKLILDVRAFVLVVMADPLCKFPDARCMTGSQFFATYFSTQKSFRLVSLHNPTLVRRRRRTKPLHIAFCSTPTSPNLDVIATHGMFIYL